MNRKSLHLSFETLLRCFFFVFLFFIFSEFKAIAGMNDPFSPNPFPNNDPRAFYNLVQKRDEAVSAAFKLKEDSLIRLQRSNLFSNSNTNVALDKPVDSKTYIVGAGDQFILNVWGSENQSLHVNVTPEGSLFIPQVGYFNVAGLTLTEIRNKIKQTIGYYYSGSNFDISLFQPRVFQLHIVGEVKNPGSYGASASERVSEVLQRAGGVLPKGSRRLIEIRRHNQVLLADISAFESFADLNGNPYVLDNDIIYVPLISRTVTFKGGVNRPNQYELAKEQNLAQALKLARGLSNLVDKNQPIQVIRSQDESDPRVYWVSSNETKSFILKDRDTIVVPSTEDSQKMVRVRGAILGDANQENNNLAELNRGEKQLLVPYVEGSTVQDLVRSIGGLAPWADFRNAYIIRQKDAQKDIKFSDPMIKNSSSTPLYASLKTDPSMGGKADTEALFSNRNERRSILKERVKSRFLNPEASRLALQSREKESQSESRQGIRVDLYKLIMKNESEGDIAIQPGDELVIPKIEDNVYVVGAVTRGGAFSYNPRYKPIEYIGLAGGFSPEAKKGKIQVMRQDGKVYSMKEGEELQPGDTIYVPSKLFPTSKDWMQLGLTLTSFGFSTLGLTMGLMGR